MQLIDISDMNVEMGFNELFFGDVLEVRVDHLNRANHSVAEVFERRTRVEEDAFVEKRIFPQSKHRWTEVESEFSVRSVFDPVCRVQLLFC